jgi:sulfate transport system substrate-binding protein
LFAAGGRDATTTFMQRGLGDVLITFESEAEMIAKEFGKGNFEVIYPSLTMQTEFPVAWSTRWWTRRARASRRRLTSITCGRRKARRMPPELPAPARSELLKKYASSSRR